MSRVVELGAARLPPAATSPVVPNEPDDMPVSVVNHWPSKPATIDPAQFRHRRGDGPVVSRGQ